MKVRAICLARNEADVIESCLREAERWCDRIFVYDGASEDGTWEKVQALAGPAIVPWRSDPAPFREGLRSEVFAAFRDEAEPGDWWCQLNADEFYVTDPREVLAAVPAHEHVVWAINVQYYLTPEDLRPGFPSGDFKRDREGMRWYLPAGLEPRFFRHRDRLAWPADAAWPRHLGIRHGRLLSFRHYPLRSPEQIQTRLDVRRAHRAAGFEGWGHAQESDWREKVEPRWVLREDRGGVADLLTDEDLRPTHLERLPVRLAKRVLHGSGIYP